jgi:hypothetical protein
MTKHDPFGGPDHRPDRPVKRPPEQTPVGRHARLFALLNNDLPIDLPPLPSPTAELTAEAEEALRANAIASLAPLPKPKGLFSRRARL